MSADCSSNCMYRMICVTSSSGAYLRTQYRDAPWCPTGLPCFFRATISILAKLLAAHGSGHTLGTWKREAAGPAGAAVGRIPLCPLLLESCDAAGVQPGCSLFRMVGFSEELDLCQRMGLHLWLSAALY